MLNIEIDSNWKDVSHVKTNEIFFFSFMMGSKVFIINSKIIFIKLNNIVLYSV